MTVRATKESVNILLRYGSCMHIHFPCKFTTCTYAEQRLVSAQIRDARMNFHLSYANRNLTPFCVLSTQLHSHMLMHEHTYPRTSMRIHQNAKTQTSEQVYVSMQVDSNRQKSMQMRI